MPIDENKKIWKFLEKAAIVNEKYILGPWEEYVLENKKKIAKVGALVALVGAAAYLGGKHGADNLVVEVHFPGKDGGPPTILK